MKDWLLRSAAHCRSEAEGMTLLRIGLAVEPCAWRCPPQPFVGVDPVRLPVRRSASSHVQAYIRCSYVSYKPTPVYKLDDADPRARLSDRTSCIADCFISTRTRICSAAFPCQACVPDPTECLDSYTICAQVFRPNKTVTTTTSRLRSAQLAFRPHDAEHPPDRMR